jgi:magnesium chelatase family protein
MDAGLVRRLVRADGSALDLLRRAYESEGMSARGHHRVLRVARTLADLGGRERVRGDDVLRALAMRQQGGGERVAAA